MLKEHQIAMVADGADPHFFDDYDYADASDKLIYCAWWAIYSPNSYRFKDYPEESREWHVRKGERITVNEKHIQTLKTFHEVLEYLETQYAIQKISA